MKEILWNSSELKALFESSSFETDVTGISIDSRAVESGDLFIALSGDPGPVFRGSDVPDNALDGHDYVGSAIANGAVGSMVRRGFSCDSPALEVEDTLEGLWRLGVAARKRSKAKIVAITGSSGKTTIRSWLERLLASIAKTHASTGSLNNHWGVPLSMARMPRDAAYGVFEIGTNREGEISRLSKLVSPDVALVLNVLPAHIGNFPGMDALEKEKLSIGEGLSDHGMLIAPYGLVKNAKGDNLLTFGLDAHADIRASAIVEGSVTRLQVRTPTESAELSIPFVGEERVQSALAVIAVLSALGVSVRDVAETFMTLDLPEGRGNSIVVNDVLIIDDSYNANPVSMQMAIRHLSQYKRPGKKYALLGEILELGDEGIAAHRDIGNQVSMLDSVLSFGEGFAAVEFNTGTHHHYDEVSDFDLKMFAKNLVPGDTVLVKGSNKVFWKNNFVQMLVDAIS